MSALHDRIAQCRKMASDDPDNELGHFRLGQLLAEAGDHAEAAKSFQRTLDLSPGFSKVFQLLGQSYMKLGRKADAIEVWTRGWKVADERGDKMPRDDMARLLREQGAPVPEPAKPKDEGPGTGFPPPRGGLLREEQRRQPPRPAAARRVAQPHLPRNLRRLLERLVPELQYQGDQRAAARPKLRVRPGRVRQAHARVLRVRLPAKAVMTIDREYLVTYGRAGFLSRFR